MASLLIAESAAAAMTPNQAVSQLNALRTSIGAAPVTEVPDWSNSCRAHDAYSARNGWGANPHDEDPSLPGFTNAGQWAAQHSMLTKGHQGETFPWIGAPFHLAGLLAPQLVKTGFDESNGYGCMVAGGEAAMRKSVPATNRIFTYPADGSSGIPNRQRVAFETPSPTEAVGLDRFTVTGPDLIVFADGPWSVDVYTEGGYTSRLWVQDATITGGGGDAPRLGVIKDRGCPCAILVPLQPLHPNTHYTVSFTAIGERVGGSTRVTRTHSFGFTTGTGLMTESGLQQTTAGTSHGSGSTGGNSSPTSPKPAVGKAGSSSQAAARISGLKFQLLDGLPVATYRLDRKGRVQVTLSRQTSAPSRVTVLHLSLTQRAGAHRLGLAFLLHGRHLRTGHYMFLVETTHSGSSTQFNVR